MHAVLGAEIEIQHKKYKFIGHRKRSFLLEDSEGNKYRVSQRKLDQLTGQFYYFPPVPDPTIKENETLLEYSKTHLNNEPIPTDKEGLLRWLCSVENTLFGNTDSLDSSCLTAQQKRLKKLCYILCDRMFDTVGKENYGLNLAELLIGKGYQITRRTQR